MDIVFLILRILLISFAALVGGVYALAHLWRRVPAPKLEFKAYDYIVYGFTGFAFGLGLNNYWGLLAFVPLLLWKLSTGVFVSKSKVVGKGSWMEVEWQRFSPRGFRMPAEAVEQIKRLPNDTHFIVPRSFSLLAIKLFMKNVRKNMGKMGNMPQMRGQEQQALDMIETIARNVTRLDKGKSEKLSLPFGELKITRL